jgi:hypothetical protein
MRAPLLPQTSQIIGLVLSSSLLKIDRDNNQLACQAQLSHNNNFIACDGSTFDEIFMLTCHNVFLTLNDLACENAAFNIKTVKPSSSISSTACTVITY